MEFDAAFVAVPGASLAGLILSLAIEGLMKPRPRWARPWRAWALHAGSWLCAHAAFTVILGRPGFAAALVLASLWVLVLVNNAKMKALREPFVFQDYEYFTDAICHPRLYLPFLGGGKFLGAASGFVLAMSIGLLWEKAPIPRFALSGSGQLGGIALVFAAGLLCLCLGKSRSQKSLALSFDPEKDLRALGLSASLWRYRDAASTPPAAISPFFSLALKEAGDLPHLIAVQSESFFDPRLLYPGIRPDVLAEFDRLKRDCVAHGKLHVPAWGANTVRTEFAFLSGIDENALGAHRFNPYRAIASGWNVFSLAAGLKRLGYRTIAIHPYPASFYQRNRVYPRIGFDEFLDLRAFDAAPRFGPYISDEAVASQIEAIVSATRNPVFVFAITMENHGPLHLERLSPQDADAFYTQPPPLGCDDLTVYLRHLRNADRMILKLRQMLERCERPASLCWFGDHVPIMPTVYEIFGAPQEVEYLCWNTRNAAFPEERKIHAHELALEWVSGSGVRD